MLRRLLISFVVGAVIGLAATLWLGPSAVTWWFTPPGVQGPFTCEVQVAEATRYLVRLQLIVGASAGVLTVLGTALGSGRRKTKVTPPPPSTGPTL